jgi:hypothetical protein
LPPSGVAQANRQELMTIPTRALSEALRFTL